MNQAHPDSVRDSVRSLAERLGVDPVDRFDDGVDWALPLIAALTSERAVVVLKLDGERAADPATVVVSGPLLDGDAIRRDGPSLGLTLAEALAELGRRRAGGAC